MDMVIRFNILLPQPSAVCCYLLQDQSKTMCLSKALTMHNHEISPLFNYDDIQISLTLITLKAFIYLISSFLSLYRKPHKK